VNAGVVDGAAASARGLEQTVRHGEWSGEGLALAAGVEFLGCEGAGVDGLVDLEVLFRAHVLVLNLIAELLIADDDALNAKSRGRLW